MSGIEFRPDGPHCDDYTADLAEAFSQVVRTLNHATMTGSGVTYPSTVYTVIGDLADGVSGLGQLLGQLHGFLTGEHAAGRLGDDRETDHDPTTALIDVQARLSRAHRAAAALATELGEAQSALSGLHTRRPHPTEEES